MTSSALWTLAYIEFLHIRLFIFNAMVSFYRAARTEMC